MDAFQYSNAHFMIASFRAPANLVLPSTAHFQTYSSEIPVQDQFYRKYVSPYI